MSKDVKINGVAYSGVSQIQLNTTDGVTALFQDVDEIVAGGGSVESGTFIGDGTKTVTIPVSSKKNYLVIDIDDDWRSNLDTYANNGTISRYHNNIHKIGLGFRRYDAVSNGYINSFANYNDNAAYQQVKFKDDSIVIPCGIQVELEPFMDGKTYKWLAW